MYVSDKAEKSESFGKCGPFSLTFDSGCLRPTGHWSDPIASLIRDILENFEDPGIYSSSQDFFTYNGIVLVLDMNPPTYH